MHRVLLCNIFDWIQFIFYAFVMQKWEIFFVPFEHLRVKKKKWNRNSRLVFFLLFQFTISKQDTCNYSVYSIVNIFAFKSINGCAKKKNRKNNNKTNYWTMSLVCNCNNWHLFRLSNLRRQKVILIKIHQHHQSTARKKKKQNKFYLFGPRLDDDAFRRWFTTRHFI